jgi:ankyrin repeat protein
MIKRSEILLSILLVFLSFSLNIAQTDDIHGAVKSGDLNKVKLLLKSNIELLNKKDKNGKTILHHAIETGNNNIAEFIIRQGADLNLKDEDNDSPLHYAASLGNLDIIKMLIERGATSINEGGYQKITPLHYACMEGHPQVVNFLLDKGANIEAREAHERTPLLAVGAGLKKGNIEIVKILVERGADINAVSITKHTTLTLAAWRGYKDIVNYLIDKKAVILEPNLEEALLNAVRNNLVYLYNYVLERGLNLTEMKNKYPLLIHYASVGGSTKIVESLIKHGFDLNKKDENGWTPFHYAASKGKIEIIRYLIKKDVDKNARNMKGETAYNLAVFQEYRDVAVCLKNAGVDSIPPKFPKLKGPYMGQESPGCKPKIFLPGIVSGHYRAHCSIAFSPDGKEAYWTEQGHPKGGVMGMKIVANKWTYPEKSKIMDGEPFFSPDGKRLYFLSKKPLGKREKDSREDIWGGKENILYMDKTDSGWSEPKPIGDAVNSMKIHWQFSLDNKYNLYFATFDNIYCSKYKDGKYQKPINITELFDNETLKGLCPFISPDGDYLLFSSSQGNMRNLDLYISFKKKDGKWSDRINLGNEINTKRNVCPKISPDGKYLFFVSSRGDKSWGIYWVSSKIIHKLKKKHL